jgi:macrolide-specific efflux system membrane fusion protein
VNFIWNFLRKRYYVAIAILALLTAGGIWFGTGSNKSTIQYETSVIVRGDIETYVDASGTVQPQNRLEIKAPIAGRMDEVLVDEGQNVKKGQILAWMSSTERAALLDAARSSSEENVKEWEKLYRPTPVVAPLSGTIISRKVEPGQTFTASDAILIMSDRLTVKAKVDETDIASITVGKNANITLDAYPETKIPAIVDQIAFEATTVNNVTTYIVDVLPGNVPEFMRSGMTANVTFTLETRTNVLLVPNEAIKYKEKIAYVLVPSKNSNPLEKEITIGITNGRDTEVLSGVNENDKILSPKLSLNGAKKSINPFSPMPRVRTPRNIR